MSLEDETLTQSAVSKQDNVPVTYSGLVQTWECDRNIHWNARFFVRAFQMASEAFALANCGQNPGAKTAKTRHIRFHHELLAAQTMTIRSAFAPAGANSSDIVHLMESGGRICATAFDVPSYDVGFGPKWDNEDVAQAAPRGLDRAPHDPSEAGSPHVFRDSVIAIVRPSEIDHMGDLLMHEIFAYCSISSNNLLTELGFSQDWIKSTGNSRMAVEMKITRHHECKVGDALVARSWIAKMTEKTFSVRHCLRTHAGEPVASVEQFLVVVNLETRRTVPVPQFLKDAYYAQATQ